MSEPSVEALVAAIEASLAVEDDHEDERNTHLRLSGENFRLLIASWRERGEALKEARKWVKNEEWFPKERRLALIDAALGSPSPTDRV